MNIKSLIQKNRHFWIHFPARKGDEKILIEAPSISMVTHVNAIYTVILNQARTLTPVFLTRSKYNLEFLKSYVPTAEFVSIPQPTRLSRIKLRLIALWKFLMMCMTRNILAFNYDGVTYGDIVYDTYLTERKVATIRRIDKHILEIIRACISRHEDILRVLRTDSFQAVLVSHPVGIPSGVMLRTSLRHGYQGYLRAGHHRSTLLCFEKLDEVYNYVYRPFPEDIDTVITTLGSDFDRVYDSIFNQQVSGKGSKDRMYAFLPDHVYYTDRQTFLVDFDLDPLKKNVFFMLHAFNDYPHSHFRWMIFKDYYDWFLKTLTFARSFRKVNWIFKQHPAIRLYHTKDVSYEDLFKNSPDNIVYIDEAKQIDTRSLICCADVVITCMGSAGFEVPAMAGIPSITAGDNFYSGLGFTLEPKTKEQYFNILKNIDNIGLLTPEQQKRARAAYMHIYQFSRIDISAAFPLSWSEQKDKDQEKWYWERVIKQYEIRGKDIVDEIRSYIDKVAKPEFKRLNSLHKYHELI